MQLITNELINVYVYVCIFYRTQLLFYLKHLSSYTFHTTVIKIIVNC